MLAVRRIAHDPVSAGAVAAAVALAVATVVVGGALADSAEDAVQAKAETFVGSDAAASIAGRDRTLPPSLAGRATVTYEEKGQSGSQRVVVLGIDPATFTDGAIVSAADLRLVAQLAGAPRGSAIVVGPLPKTTIEPDHGGAVTVDPIARASTFPTSRTSSTLVVVDATLLDGARTTADVLARMPGDELESALRSAGRRVTGVVTVDATVTGTSRAAVRWAYAALRVLGAVVVAVLLGVLLARRAARARQRELAEVFTAAMGLNRRRALVAELIEQGLPLVTGLAVGIVVALLAAHQAVPDLDSARILPPRASLIVPGASLAVVVVVAAVTLALVVVTARRQARRARAGVVLRG
jgi:putative ABC transport system permease protein